MAYWFQGPPTLNYLVFLVLYANLSKSRSKPSLEKETDLAKLLLIRERLRRCSRGRLLDFPYRDRGTACRKVAASPLSWVS